jgi:Short C-terminal domain
MSVFSFLADLSPEARNQVLIALGIMMVLVMVGGFGILIFRRRWQEAEDADGSANVGFSLSDLREMRDRGEITPEEYEVTRMKVITKVKASLSAGPPGKISPPPLRETDDDGTDAPRPG